MQIIIVKISKKNIFSLDADSVPERLTDFPAKKMCYLTRMGSNPIVVALLFFLNISVN